jgi:transposase
MPDIDCDDCGTVLAVVTPNDTAVRRSTTRRRVAFPSRLLQCPRCGAVWERDLAGVTTRRAPGSTNPGRAEPGR